MSNMEDVGFTDTSALPWAHVPGGRSTMHRNGEMTHSTLLLEIGTEELPVSALPTLADALLANVIAGLAHHRVACDAAQARALYTPRRLAIFVPQVADQQPDQDQHIPGPTTAIGLDAQGQPTRALLGFAAKYHVSWRDLPVEHDGKGERFTLHLRTSGQATLQILPELLHQAIANLPIAKPMRWGTHDQAFIRPVHWLVALLGATVVPVTAFGQTAQRASRGHRFLHPHSVPLTTADVYLDALRAAYVCADPEERRLRIAQDVAQAAQSCQCVARITAKNLHEVNCLVEWPQTIVGRFASDFLEVPQEALIQTMEHHQKFFPLFDAQGRLTSWFIGVANIRSQQPEEIQRGYERVIRPRFADAKFFYDADCQQGLIPMGVGLERVTEHAQLGTIADKVTRLVKLAESLASQLGVDVTLAKRAAQLSKNDLQSRLVGEFPELQGVAGRYYARAAGEPETIALALDQAYQPRWAQDAVAPSPLGQVLAIVDRIDHLVGGFAVGSQPTGNKDPFALRRAGLGLARTIVHHHLDCDIVALLQQASRQIIAQCQLQAERSSLLMTTPVQTKKSCGVELSPDSLTQAVYAFVIERLRHYYAEQGVPGTHFTAVAECSPRSLSDLDRRIQALRRFSQLPEAPALIAANKRIRNLLRKSQDKLPNAVDANLLVEPAEQALAQAITTAHAQTRVAWQAQDYAAVLARLAGLRDQVDHFFDTVMVNVPDPLRRTNRLALLQELSQLLSSVAAIDQLVA